MGPIGCRKAVLAMGLGVGLMAAFAMTSCTPARNGAAKPSFTKETYPKVDGSTATIPLSKSIASELLSLTSEEAHSYMKHNTMHNAYVNLIEGKADIVFVTEPSEEELNLAKEKGIELEMVPVVNEALVFLVNKQNPVDTLTVKQFQDIYQGLATNWNQVGGADKEIIAYQRPENSGSQTIMGKQVPLSADLRTRLWRKR